MFQNVCNFRKRNILYFLIWKTQTNIKKKFRSVSGDLKHFPFLSKILTNGSWYLLKNGNTFNFFIYFILESFLKINVKDSSEKNFFFLCVGGKTFRFELRSGSHVWLSLPLKTSTYYPWIYPQFGTAFSFTSDYTVVLIPQDSLYPYCSADPSDFLILLCFQVVCHC